MRMLRICTCMICAVLAACTTPPEIKQALVAKDQAYAQNEQLMEQQRAFLVSKHDHLSRACMLHGDFLRLMRQKSQPIP